MLSNVPPARQKSPVFDDIIALGWVVSLLIGYIVITRRTIYIVRHCIGRQRVFGVTSPQKVSVYLRTHFMKHYLL